MSKTNRDRPANESVNRYYEWCREDILSLIPKEAHSILSVGCASGATESRLVEKGCRVVGIELNPHAASMARSRGIDVIEKDALDAQVDLDGEIFDCIIYADVLEHLARPVDVLKGNLKSLRIGGTIVISVPNFRHITVLAALFCGGEFKYSEAGIFDETHLRITTCKSTCRWVTGLGMEVERIEWIHHGRLMRLVSAISFGTLREFTAKQVIVVAKLG